MPKALTPPPDVQNAFRFFPESVCVLSTYTNLNYAHKVHIVHAGMFSVHVVFFKCGQLRNLFFSKSARTKDPQPDLQFWI